MNYISKIFLLIFIFRIFAFPKQPMIFFSVGIKCSQNGISKIYAETSYWPINPERFPSIPAGIGVDAGIEIGKIIEIYGEAEWGLGLLGYSHGLYYRIPLSLQYGNSYGQRGKLWFTCLPFYILFPESYSSYYAFYMAIDLDYENRDFSQWSFFINYHNIDWWQGSGCLMAGGLC